MKKIKVLDLFAGIGGLSHSFFKDKDFEIIAANEIDKDIAKAYTLNHPKTPMYCKNIADFGVRDLRADLGVEEVDVILGGPPCQPFSTLGKREQGDRRRLLFKEYARLVKELKPKLFVFENVSGLLSIDKGEFFKEILKLFEDLGYKLSFKLLNALEFGSPQTRKRIFVVGSKLAREFTFPVPTHASKDKSCLLENALSLKDALEDLPLEAREEATYASPPKNAYQARMRKGSKDLIKEHVVPRNNLKLIKLMKALPDGGTPKDLPLELRPKSGFSNTYSKLWWERPATTITRNFSTPSSSRCIHPKASRPLSIREAARLQGFEDSYVFYGSHSKKCLQIGNAVPTSLSLAIKQSIKDCI